MSQEDNDPLQVLPSLDKVRAVVFSLSCDSTPSPGGFGIGFYKACWDVIKQDLLLVVHDFFREPSLCVLLLAR